MENPEIRLRKSLPGRATAPYPPVPADVKLSAVLTLLSRHPDGWKILLTRRGDQLADHRGQIAFPGGHAEEGDSGPLQTALREACEETGIAPGAVRPLGILDPVDTSSGFRIWPVVGIVSWPVELQPAPAEVVEAFWIPLDWLMAEGRWGGKSVNPGDPNDARRAVFFEPYQGRVVWGATAKILVNLLEMVRKGNPA
jgi:8-oxo-dGTP pyrophosphatase MutT (NUDIX family)